MFNVYLSDIHTYDSYGVESSVFVIHSFIHSFIHELSETFRGVVSRGTQSINQLAMWRDDWEFLKLENHAM